MKQAWQGFFVALFLLSAILSQWLAPTQDELLRGVETWVSYPSLQPLVEETLYGRDGHYGVAIKHLTNGEIARYNAGAQAISASLYKLAVLYAVLKEESEGRLSLDEALTMTATASVDDEEPSIAMGGAITVREAVFQMITVSDNASALLLLYRVGVPELNLMMRELGLTQTEIGTGDVALTSPDDMLLLLEKIYKGEGQTEQARQEMLSVLLQQTVNDRLPRYLPPGTLVAHKTGELYDVRNDAGIVFAPGGPYIIVVMARDLPNIDEGMEVAAQLSKTVYDYFIRFSR